MRLLRSCEEAPLYLVQAALRRIDHWTGSLTPALAHLRPTYANHDSVTEGKPGIPPEPIFFVNLSGQRLTESRVSRKVMGQQMDADVHRAGLRKSLISKQRKMGHS